ncbi:MAG TPA: DUF6279 family lipoprotein [Albitalea sp.]|nr:DUF6279 family lipoprotein [Albitalea sp.]
MRTAIIGGLLAALALLAGCSALRLGYNQGPDLAYWWLDRYVDFDEQQEPRAREAIAAWFAWHRRTQLPDYAALLEKAQGEILDPATPAQMCRWMDELTLRLDRAFEQALPPLAETVRTMSPQQLAHLEEKYAKNNKEYRHDFLQPDAQERRRAQVKRVSDRAELLYGRLNDAQRERIAQLTADSPFDPEGWYVERQRRQQDTLQTLRRLLAEHSGPAETQAALRRLYEQMLRSPRPEYRDYQQRLLQFNCAFAADVHDLATPLQRLHARKRLRGWEDDVRALAAQGR